MLQKCRSPSRCDSGRTRASAWKYRRERHPDPDVVRADISKRLPESARNRNGWAIDIFAAFEALSIKPTPQNICAVIAITEQESTFQVNPPVPEIGRASCRE